VFSVRKENILIFLVEIHNLKDYRQTVGMTCNTMLVLNLDLVEFKTVTVPR
jgi:hypothetical protein